MINRFLIDNNLSMKYLEFNLLFYVNLINILDGKLDVLKPTLDNYIETNQDWYLNYVAVYDNEAVLVLMKDKLLKVY